VIINLLHKINKRGLWFFLIRSIEPLDVTNSILPIEVYCVWFQASVAKISWPLMLGLTV